MTFQPSPLAHAMAVIIGWTICLAIVLDRVELLFVAVPILVRLMGARAPAPARVHSFDLAIEPGPRTEGEQIPIAVRAVIEATPGPVEILPVLPALLAPWRRAVTLPRLDGAVSWEFAPFCQASGMLDFGAVFFRLWDRTGLRVAEARLERRTTLLVHPRALIIRTLPAPRQAGVPFGLHTSRRVGDGIDFADIRRYVPGDRMKRINWPVSLRSGDLHVNRFHAERSADVILLLDCFGNVGVRPDSSLDHCLRAAAGLAMAYLRRHDRVGLVAFGGLARWTRTVAGLAHYPEILQALARAAIAPSVFLQDLAALPHSVLPRQALVIALTPLLDERFAQAVSRLADQGRDIILLALRTDELTEAYLSRANRALTRRLWLLERQRRLMTLHGHGVRAVHWSPSQPLDAALARVHRPTMRIYAA